MKTNIFSLRSHGQMGPGGWRCSCCRIPPKGRRAAAKAQKRRIERLLSKMEKDSE